MVGGSSGGSGTDTTLRLSPLASSTPFMPSQRRIKQKWCTTSDSLGQLAGIPPCLRVGNSSSSSGCKGSSEIACTSISAAKEFCEETSMNLELDFGLHIVNESVSSPKRSFTFHSNSSCVCPKVDLELSLSSGVADSTTHGASSIYSENIVKQNLTVGAHGGGRRCEFLGCIKSAKCSTDFCIEHGGGRRCGHESCTRAAKDNSGLCVRHGGGKRCSKDKCTKGAVALSGLCVAHGGGRRCQYPKCSKGAQGSTMLCKAHGGGKRCSSQGCPSCAEGRTPFCKRHGGGKRCSFQGGGVCPRSVHGGTLFCVGHEGGKRCVVPECAKSVSGRTDFCVRHGGGKRCKFDGCLKSAQGCSDLCRAHGGGTRCSWGHPGSEFGNGDLPCNSLSRGKPRLCARHGALVQDKCVHGGAALVQDSKPEEPTSSGLKPGGLLVKDINSTERIISESRVHGGSLISILSGN